MAGKKKTSRRTATKAITVRSAPAAPRTTPTQIVVRAPSTPTRAAPKKRRPAPRRSASMGSRGGGAFGLPSDLISSSAAGLLVGVMKSTGLLEKLPRLPYVGRVGAAAIAAHFIARATGSATARDARNALAVLATYQLGSNSGALSDRIEGDGPEVIDAE